MITATLNNVALTLPWLIFFITIGLLFIGFGIWFVEKTKFIKFRKSNHDDHFKNIGPHRVAVLIASKNGENTIGETIKYARRNRRKVFVVSDGSTDHTAKIAKSAGAEVLSLRKNIGKPSALKRAYKHFNLSKRFDAVAILDDDVLISPDFIKQAKSVMNKSTAIAVGRNITYWPNSRRWNAWLAVRSYSYWSYQLTIRRIQSVLNVMNCISGSNSIYRTEVLDEVLTNQTPYIVDDTYWTLETHRKNLGEIKYAPSADAWIQDPTTFKDWYKQNLRWMWGTFQGVLGHRIGSRFNKFHMSYVLLITEWILYIASGPLLVYLLFAAGTDNIARQLTLLILGYGLWTVVASISLKVPRLVIFTPFILVSDMLFRVIMIHSFFKALKHRTVASCVWDSPKRISEI